MWEWHPDTPRGAGGGISCDGTSLVPNKSRIGVLVYSSHPSGSPGPVGPTCLRNCGFCDCSNLGAAYTSKHGVNSCRVFWVQALWKRVCTA